MPTTKKPAVLAVIAIILIAAALSCFVKPHPRPVELVPVHQEFPNLKDHYPGDTSLADRTSRSYGLAMVLVTSPYTQKNEIALETVRSWAREKFQRTPDFLHPASLETAPVPTQTIIEALLFNLTQEPRYLIDHQIDLFLKQQIHGFHHTKAYQSFLNAYFDLFGKDADSAHLLARYQADKAIQSRSAIFWATLWLTFGAAAVASLWLCRSSHRLKGLQYVLSSSWLLLAVMYFAQSWTDNRVSLLLSAVVCSCVGFYLRKPFYVGLVGNSLPVTRAVAFDPRWIALSVWLTFSLMAMQIITWIKTGTPASPDPITLLLSGLSGNFLHDPIQGKRWLIRILGAGWLTISAWALSQRAATAQDARRTEETLNSLKAKVPF